MAQTALTKALQQIKALYVKYDHLDNMLLNRDDVIQLLTDLLPYEREVIEGAYRQGESDTSKQSVLGIFNRPYKNRYDYFTKTYNQ